MKKFIMLLLVMVLTIFALTGCDGITPAEGEGEGEAEFEGSCPEITLSGSVVIDGKTYLRGLSVWDDGLYRAGPELANTYDDIILTITYENPTEGAAAYLGGLPYGFINTLIEGDV